MARNQEKASGVLNRWTTMKSELRRGPQKKKEVRFASDCRYLPDAERRRRMLLNDITQRIEEIQNATLGEHRIRELNDEINKLLKEKFEWERQIVKLGGRNYTQRKTVAYDDSGKEIPGSSGYQYFGAARNLPGVRELFEPAPKAPPKRKREEILKNLSHTYFGFERKENEKLIEVERNAEQRQREMLCAQWDEKNGGGEEEAGSDSSEDEEAELRRKAEERKKFEEEKAKIAAQEQLRLAQRKKELLARLANE